MISVNKVSAQPYFTAAQYAQRPDDTEQTMTAFDKYEDEPSEKKSSFGKKIAIGLGFAALAAAGIYLLRKGKGKKVVDEAQEITKKLSNGKTVKKSVEDNKTIMSVYDENGNFLYSKTKEINRTINPENGKKYITKTEDYHAANKDDYTTVNGYTFFKGDGTRVTNRYYDTDGNKIFETIYRNNKSDRLTPDIRKDRMIYDKGSETRRTETYFSGDDGKLHKDSRNTYGINPQTGHTTIKIEKNTADGWKELE